MQLVPDSMNCAHSARARPLSDGLTADVRLLRLRNRAAALRGSPDGGALR